MQRSVIVIAPASPTTRAVRDVLRDWAALGLVSTYVWLDEQELTSPEAATLAAATVVSGHAARRVQLEGYLADAQASTGLRVVALSAVDAHPAQADADRAQGLFNRLQGKHVASPIHCVLTRHGKGGWDPALAWMAWHTLVVAPEDAWHPGRAPEPMRIGDNGEYVIHCAAALATVAGLWCGMGEGPLDDVPVPGNRDVTVVRSFMRRLDAAPVSTALRRQLTSTEHGLPAPVGLTGPLVEVENVRGAAAAAVEALWTQNAPLFQLDRESGRQVSVGVSWRVAVRAFFAFLLDVARKTPRAWVQSEKDRAAATLARRTQSALYGDGSRYEVLVAGVGRHGRNPRPEELAGELEDVAARVNAVGAAVDLVTPDMGTFWEQYVAGALTLADGGERPGAVPARVGASPGYVRDVRRIVPAPDDRFELPPHLSAAVGAHNVDPYDVSGWIHTERALSAAAADGDADAAETRSRLHGWVGSLRDSYAGAAGLRLAQEMEARRAEVGALLQQLSAARADDDAALDDARKQGRRKLRRACLMLMLGFLLLAAGVALGPITAGTATAIAAGFFLLWLIRLFVAFFRTQLEVNRILNQQGRAEDAAVLAQRNLKAAMRDMNRAVTQYAQYMAWTPVLGRFLTEPFGRVPETQAPLRMEGSLARSVGFAVTHVDEERVAQTAYSLGKKLFPTGWLSQVWEQVVTDAATRVGGQDGQVLRDDPRRLLRDTARSPRSPLRTWSAQIAAQGVGDAGGALLWAQTRHELQRRGVSQLVDAVLTEVDTVGQEGHGIDGRTSGRAFLTELTEAVQSEGARFSKEIFDHTAITDGYRSVASSLVVGSQELLPEVPAHVRRIDPADTGDDDLDQFVVVLQRSRPIPARLLLLEGGAGKPPPPPRRPEPPDDPLANGRF